MRVTVTETMVRQLPERRLAGRSVAGVEDAEGLGETESRWVY
jgi:hypothetical protein